MLRAFESFANHIRNFWSKLHSSPIFSEENTFPKRLAGVLRRRYCRLTTHLAQRRSRKLIEAFNVQYPNLRISLLDIGARRGIEGRYDILTGLKNFQVEGIEPDKKEAEALLIRGPYRKVHPVAVADKIGSRLIYVTRVLGCTSIHEPNVENLRRYSISTWFEVQAKAELQVTTLESLFSRGERFDFISMDVQGAEHEVMSGGERLFDQALGISLEVHFVEIYKHQNLFPSMHDLLLKKGFRLILLGACDFDGEIAEAECAYIKDHQLLRNKEDVLKCILFSLNWRNKAYVENLLRNVSNDLLPESEKKRILRVLRIEERHKSSPGADGISAAAYRDGSGYF